MPLTPNPITDVLVRATDLIKATEKFFEYIY